VANHYFDTVITTTGRPIPGAKIYVYEADGVTLATIYSDDGVTVINQAVSPITTDSNGFFDFWTEDNSVTISYTVGGVQRKRIVDVETVGDYSFADLPTLPGLSIPAGSNLIGFSHAGNYAAGTVGHKLFRIVNVTDAPFSAKGDGVTDDTASIQAAIDYVGAVGGGKVVFPAGIYLYRNTSPDLSPSTYFGCGLKMPYSNVVLEGVGDRSVLKAMDTSGAYGAIQMTIVPIANGTPAIYRSGIRNMRIDGGYSGTTTGSVPMVYGVGLVDCFFENVYFTKSAHYLLGLQNGGHQGVVVRNCWFDDNVRDAIDVKNNVNAGTVLSVGKGLQFLGCHFKNNCRGADAADPFAVLDVMSPGVIIDDCHFYDFSTDANVTNTNAAIRLKPGLDPAASGRGIGAQYANISNVYIYKLPAARAIDAAIEVRAPYANIQNAQIRGDFVDGIRPSQAYTGIDSGTIDGPTAHGVYFRGLVGAEVDAHPYTGADHCYVTGVTFLNTPIGVETVRSDITVMNNTFGAGVSTNCVKASTSGSPRMTVISNNMVDATAATKINIDTNRNHTIHGNLGAPGMLQQVLATTLVDHVYKIGATHRFFTGYDGSDPASGVEQVRINHVANAVNRLQMQGAATGGVSILSAGGETDASMRVAANGAGAIQVGSATNRVGFYAGAGALKQTVTGAKGGNAALASLLAALVAVGLVTDTTTA